MDSADQFIFRKAGAMRVVVQRVLGAKVEVEGESVGRIERGLLVYVSVGSDDTCDDAKFIAEKVGGLRIFGDNEGKMNLSVKDVGGKVLAVSNFTLHGDCRKGRRPGFDAAARPEVAEGLYEEVCKLIAGQGIAVEKGVFGAHMKVESVNDGPVTFILDSSKLF